MAEDDLAAGRDRAGRNTPAADRTPRSRRSRREWVTPTQVRALDQAISSGTNFVWLVAVTSVSSPSDFGAFGLATSLFAVALGATRTTVSERISLRVDASRHAIASVTWVLVAAASIAAFAVLWLATDRPVTAVWLLLSVTILLQDRLRYVALGACPRVAVIADAVWLILVAIGWMWCATFDVGSAVSAWIVSLPGVVASIVVLAIGVRNFVRPTIERDLAASLAEWRYVLDTWLLAGAVFVALALIASLSSLAEAGSARVMLLLFQPFLSIVYAGRLRVLGRPDADVSRWPRSLAAACVIYGIVAGGVLAGLARAGAVPSVWKIGAPAFLLVTLSQVARSYHQGISDIARRRRPHGLLAARAVFAVVLVGVTSVTTGSHGAGGYAVALLLSFAAGAIVADRTVAWRSADGSDAKR